MNLASAHLSPRRRIADKPEVGSHFVLSTHQVAPSHRALLPIEDPFAGLGESWQRAKKLSRAIGA